MLLTLTRAVGIFRPHHHRHGCNCIRNHRYEADLKIGQSRCKALDDLRHPQGQAVDADGEPGVDHREQQHVRVTERLPHREVPRRRARCRLHLQAKGV